LAGSSTALLLIKIEEKPIWIPKGDTTRIRLSTQEFVILPQTFVQNYNLIRYELRNTRQAKNVPHFPSSCLS